MALVVVALWLLMFVVAIARARPVANRYDALYRARYGGVTDPDVLHAEAWSNPVRAAIKGVRERDRMDASVSSGVLRDAELEALYRLRRRRFLELGATVFLGPLAALVIALPMAWLLERAGALDGTLWTVVAWSAIGLELAAIGLWARRLSADESFDSRVALLGILGFVLAVATTARILLAN